MKKFSIEEKSKRYDEALERAKAYQGHDVECALEVIFPELKESEDERIRKKLIAYCQVNMGHTWHSIKQEDYIAWLEKQGEHANFRNKIQIGDKVTRNEDGVLVNLSQLNRVAKKQGEQKPADKVEHKFKVGQTIKKEGFNLGFTIAKIEDSFYYNDEGDYFPFTDQDNWKLVEQKTAWSEEDELHIRELESLVKQVWAIAEHENDKETIHKMSDLSFFLKTLKPQLKQEWSEEDERVLLLLLNDYKQAVEHRPSSLTHAEVLDIYNWLKSLRPQDTWKPSEEQMEALKGVQEGVFRLGILESLYQDLKKLKG